MYLLVRMSSALGSQSLVHMGRRRSSKSYAHLSLAWCTRVALYVKCLSGLTVLRQCKQ